MTMEVYDRNGEWRWIDGLYNWEDQNHAGKAWVTEEMVKKYEMKEEETLLEY